MGAIIEWSRIALLPNAVEGDTDSRRKMSIKQNDIFLLFATYHFILGRNSVYRQFGGETVIVPLTKCAASVSDPSALVLETHREISDILCNDELIESFDALTAELSEIDNFLPFCSKLTDMLCSSESPIGPETHIGVHLLTVIERLQHLDLTELTEVLSKFSDTRAGVSASPKLKQSLPASTTLKNAIKENKFEAAVGAVAAWLEAEAAKASNSSPDAKSNPTLPGEMWTALLESEVSFGSLQTFRSLMRTAIAAAPSQDPALMPLLGVCAARMEVALLKKGGRMDGCSDVRGLARMLCLSIHRLSRLTRERVEKFADGTQMDRDTQKVYPIWMKTFATACCELARIIIAYPDELLSPNSGCRQEIMTCMSEVPPFVRPERSAQQVLMQKKRLARQRALEVQRMLQSGQVSDPMQATELLMQAQRSANSADQSEAADDARREEAVRNHLDLITGSGHFAEETANMQSSQPAHATATAPASGTSPDEVVKEVLLQLMRAGGEAFALGLKGATMGPAEGGAAVPHAPPHVKAAVALFDAETDVRASALQAVENLMMFADMAVAVASPLEPSPALVALVAGVRKLASSSNFTGRPSATTGGKGVHANTFSKDEWEMGGGKELHDACELWRRGHRGAARRRMMELLEGPSAVGSTTRACIEYIMGLPTGTTTPHMDGRRRLLEGRRLLSQVESGASQEDLQAVLDIADELYETAGLYSDTPLQILSTCLMGDVAFAQDDLTGAVSCYEYAVETLVEKKQTVLSPEDKETVLEAAQMLEGIMMRASTTSENASGFLCSDADRSRLARLVGQAKTALDTM